VTGYDYNPINKSKSLNDSGLEKTSSSDTILTVFFPFSKCVVIFKGRSMDCKSISAV